MGCYVLLILLASACGGKDEGDAAESGGFNFAKFAERFKSANPPYVLTDQDLLRNRDTSAIRDPWFLARIPDSLKRKMFGKTTGIRWVPLARIDTEEETYFITKGSSGNGSAALLTTFDKEKVYGASMPFLVPDKVPASTQVSAIDRQHSISKTTTSKLKYDVIVEGKDVFIYNRAAKGYTLIITDELNEKEGELVNPIDTLGKKHRFAGDYLRGKNNIVSVRDGRTPSEVRFFVHLEQADGACVAELKGSAFFTSGSMAVYRQGGDHCVLQLQFTGKAVSLREEQGCGAHRGLDCPFEGSFPKKKSPKPAPKKTGSRSGKLPDRSIRR